MTLYPKVSLIAASAVTFLFCTFLTTQAQVTRTEAVQVKPPLIRMIDPPSADATANDLESRGDELHGQKLYFDAIDYYRAALLKSPAKGRILNKICRTQLVMARWRDAQKSCEQAIKVDRTMGDPHNNLGVALYEEGHFGAAVKQYHKAIAIDDTSASFYSNLGAALFSKKQFEPAVVAYQKAMEIDPEVFDRTSRTGVQAQLPSPGDRAHYDYTVAKLYAKMGFSDRSLEYLKKAMEEGYKDFKNVYKDAEFAELRRDKRFVELMASKPATLPD